MVQSLWAVAVRSCEQRPGTVQPRVRGTSTVGSCYQTAASEDCNRLRKLVSV
jgi:hypothetical protein